MKKNLKRVLISVAIIICAFSAIAFAAADGDEAVDYGALCLIAPLVTIVFYFYCCSPPTKYLPPPVS